MRWKAIYIVCGTSLILGLLTFFCFNNLLAWLISNSLETIIGAKVEVNRAQFSLAKLSLKIENLQLTNPVDTWKNLIETRNLSLKLAWEPLFMGRTVIEEVAVEDLIINSPRQSDGKLHRKLLPGPLGVAQAKLHKDIISIPILDPKKLGDSLKTNSATNSYKLQTTVAAAELDQRIDTSYREWQQKLQDMEQLKVSLGELGQKLAELQKQKIKSVLDVKPQLDKVNDLQKELKSIEGQFTKTKTGLGGDFAELSAAITNLKDIAESDYKELLNLAKLPAGQSLNYTEALLGKALLNESTSFINMADQVLQKLPVRIENPPKEKHPRGGQDITFPGRKTYPRFLIKRIYISGKGTPGTKLTGFYAKGTATGITSEPSLYGLPLTASVYATGAGQSYLDLKGELNHLSPSFKDHFQIIVGNLPLPGFTLPENQYLPDWISSGSAEINSDFTLEPGQFKLSMVIKCANLKAEYTTEPDHSKDLMVGIIRDSLQRVNQVNINYELKSINNQMQMKITSDLDNIIAAQFKKVVGERVTRYTQELRAKVDTELKQKQAYLEKTKQQYQDALTIRLNEVQLQIDKENRIIEEKRQELEAEKKKLQKQLGTELDKLKNQLK